MTTTRPDDFQQIADKQSRNSILAEFWSFLCDNKKWWLLPILLLLLALGALILLSGTAAAPFIYTLF